MGTSRDYTGSPKWGQIKGAVTRSIVNGQLRADRIPGIVRRLVGAINAGSDGTNFRGGGGSNRGGGRKASASVLGGGVFGTARAIGSFIQEVTEKGLAKALDSLGISLSSQHTPEQIILLLCDALTGPATTIDSVDLRAALSDLLEELLGEATSTDALENALISLNQDLERIILSLFGGYIFQRFNSLMCARLQAQESLTSARDCLQQVRDYITVELRLDTIDSDVRRIDWAGEEGATLVQSILDRTIHVFELDK
jgi:hypothetical protein